MRVLEHTPARLALRLGIPLLGGVTCTLDRGDGTVRVERRILLWRRRATHPLAEVTGVEVARQESSSDAAMGVIHFPVLVLRSGARLPLSGVGERGADAAAERIRTFLHAG